MRAPERPPLLRRLETPDDLRAAFGQPGGHGYYQSRGWLETLAMKTGQGEDVHLLTLPPSVVLPVRIGRDNLARLVPARVIASWTNAYCADFCPHYEPDRLPDGAAMDAAIREMEDSIAFDAFMVEKASVDDPALLALKSAFAGRGYRIQEFDNFENWYERVEGDGFEAYLAARSPKVLNEIRRRMRRLEAGHSGVRFVCVRAPEDVAGPLGDFKAVYRASWKGAEAHPDFIDAICRRAAGDGALRLSVLHADGRPIAAKICFLHDGLLSMFKTAYDPAWKPYAPGDLINYLTLQRIFDEGAPAEIEFGIGGEPYKRKWVGSCRVRGGFIAFNPRRPAGKLAGFLTGLAGRARQWRGAAPRTTPD